MNFGVRRLAYLAAAVLAVSTPLLAQPVCTVPTPEPATLWLIGGGAGAVLLLRKLRAKK